MLEVLAFILLVIIAFAVYEGIKFIGRFDIGKIVLLIYLVVNLTGDLINLLIKVLK